MREYGTVFIGLDDAYPGFFEMKELVLEFINIFKNDTEIVIDSDNEDNKFVNDSDSENEGEYNDNGIDSNSDFDSDSDSDYDRNTNRHIADISNFDDSYFVIDPDRDPVSDFDKIFVRDFDSESESESESENKIKINSVIN